MSICVVGAGINGLSTAVCIQELEPKAKITLMAENITPNTLSDIPAGFWRPYYMPDPRKDLIKKWGDATFRKIAELWKENAKDYGIDMVSGYELTKKPINMDELFWKDIVYGLRRVPKEEIKRLGHPEFSFQQNGGLLLEKRLDSLAEIAEGFDVIVNCTGLGSHHLVNDKESYPVRGQVFRVKAPFAKMFRIFDEDYYLLPNQDSVVVGGTHQENDWDVRVRRSDSEKIWKNITNYLPYMKEGKIIQEVVGLRPGRKSVRLETEMMDLGGKKVPVGIM